MVAVTRGNHGVQEVFRGQRMACLLHSAPPDLPTAPLHLCACLSALLLSCSPS